MKRKTIILGVLAILCIFWMGGYGLKLYGEYFDRKQVWNEEARAGKIWEKYGVGNGGGAIFMVDKEGKILAVKPSAEEVEAILKKWF